MNEYDKMINDLLNSDDPDLIDIAKLALQRSYKIVGIRDNAPKELEEFLYELDIDPDEKEELRAKGFAGIADGVWYTLHGSKFVEWYDGI